MRLLCYSLISLTILALMFASTAPVRAETYVIDAAGINLTGGTTASSTDYAGTYSRTMSWSDQPVSHLSVAARGWNSEFGWHVVSEPSFGCYNCTYQEVTAYRCGTNPSNCAAANYIIGYHYWENSSFGARDFFTSHDGGASGYCWWYRDC